jgi:hypothetical protein
MAMPNYQAIGLNNDQIETFDKYLEDDDLLVHVEIELTRGQKFVDVATSLGLSNYALRRKLQSFGWGRVYHNLNPKDLEMIPQSVPLTRVGCN